MTAMHLLRHLKEPITRKIVLLAVLLFGALGLLLAQRHVAHVYTSRCQEALDNQHAKRSLGWIIRKKLVQAESTLHQLAVEGDARNVRVLRERIAQRVTSIERALTILSNGGVYEHVTRINFENTDEFRETISYAKDESEGFVIEVVELVPKLVDLECNVEDLADAVRKRIVAEDDTSRQALSDMIALRRKQAEATLLRCGETANKIYRDTGQELAAIERKSVELAARTRLAERATAGILGLLCMVVAGITLRQVVGILEERKGLLGDLRKHSDHLDELVTERTIALAGANAQLEQEITERKQAEAGVRESEGRLKVILDANPTGIVIIDLETHEIVEANPVAVKMIGVSRERILGRKYHKYICPAAFGQCPITDLGQEVDNAERVLIRADGEEVPILKTVVPIALDGRECLLESFIDITERKRAEAKLRESEERHRAITESAQDAVITADAEGNIRFWNGAAEKIFGFTASEAVGKNLMGLIVPPQYHEAKRKGLTEFGRTGHGAVIGNTLELTALRKDGTEFPIEISLSGYKRTGSFMAVALVRDITERSLAKAELERAHTETRQLFEAISSILIGVDRDGRVTAWNGTAERTFGIETNKAVGRLFDDLEIEWDQAAVAEGISECLTKNVVRRLDEMRFKRPDGTEGFLGMTLNPLNGGPDKHGGFLLVALDITQHKVLQSQLGEAQKLESIGQLAAGIAHEINTPTQYVGDNMRFLRDSVQDMIKIIDQYAELLAPNKEPRSWDERTAEIKAALEELDADFLKEEIPKAIEQSLEGVERVATIVRSMKEFSHPGSDEKQMADLNKAIESTITVARNEWKYVAETVMDFDPSLPLVPCLLGNLNQVILNMIVNAAHAITDVVGKDSGEKGTITISTRQEGDWAEIRISDTGTGIPEGVRAKVFDPFFTTKDVGKGTGQGLAIARTTVVKKHGGELSVESEVGHGTTFIIRLPLEAEPDENTGTESHEEAYSLR